MPTRGEEKVVLVGDLLVHHIDSPYVVCFMFRGAVSPAPEIHEHLGHRPQL